MRRAGTAGEPAPALDHAAEPVLLDGTGSMHARVECGWPGGLLGVEGLAHTKGWGASAAIKSDVSGAQVLNMSVGWEV